MTEHVQQTIRALEQELEALDQQRGDLEAAIGALQRLGVPTAAPVKARRPASPGKRPRAAVKAAPAGDDADKVLNAIPQGQALFIRDVVESSKLSKYAVRKALDQLVKAKRVVVTGNGRGQRVSLPGKRPAKEEPQGRR